MSKTFKNELDEVTGAAIVDDDNLRSKEDDEKKFRTATYLFGIYEVKLLLNELNECIGIVEVKVNKEFLSQAQRIASTSFNDVDDPYEKEEESD